MATTLDAPELGSDISECDREPIHIPGSIQPHGLLLIVRDTDLQVVGGAGDLEEQFGADWQGRTVAALLGASSAETLSASGCANCPLGRVEGTRWEATGRRVGNLWWSNLNAPNSSRQRTSLAGSTTSD